MRSTFFLLMSHVSWCLFVICFLLGGFSVILFSCPLNANAHSYSVQFKSSPIIIVVNFRLVDFTLARLFSLLLKIWFPYNLTLPLRFLRPIQLYFYYNVQLYTHFLVLRSWFIFETWALSFPCFVPYSHFSSFLFWYNVICSMTCNSH